MIDLPIDAEVHCSDGLAGRSTGVIGNPVNCQVTHLLVKSFLPPFHEYLVPVDQVEGPTEERITLKCTRGELNKMEPFEYEEYTPTASINDLDWPSIRPDYLDWPYVDSPARWELVKEKFPYTSVKRENIPPGEFALKRGAHVEATDGYVGQIDGLLIDSTKRRVTHLVLLEKRLLQKRGITVPVSQIDHIDKDTIYLKLDRQSIEELPTTTMQPWSR